LIFPLLTLLASAAALSPFTALLAHQLRLLLQFDRQMMVVFLPSLFSVGHCLLRCDDGDASAAAC